MRTTPSSTFSLSTLSSASLRRSSFKQKDPKEVLLAEAAYNIGEVLALSGSVASAQHDYVRMFL